MGTFAWSLAALLACAQAPPANVPAHPPFVDQPAWLGELRARRPDLLQPGRGTVKDPGWQALVLRPRYRAKLLASKDATYESLVAPMYTRAQRESDAAWADALRAAQGAFVPTSSVVPAGYPLHAYVGYRVGPPMRPGDGVVVDHKAFFEFEHFQLSLAPERYAAFVARLAAAGFEGDSKIDLRPGQARFQFNQLIVHAPTEEMARCAEAVGLAFFGAEIEHVGRGVDARVDGRPTDWHHFLLSGGYDALPAEFRDFVEYRVPIGALSACRADTTPIASSDAGRADDLDAVTARPAPPPAGSSPAGR